MARTALPLVTGLLVGAASPALAQEKLHFTYHWHMEQPIYWPDQKVSLPDRYEHAWESIQRTDGGAPHPANDLRAIFGKADRVAAYQGRPRDTVSSISWAPEAGAQMSYSGGLILNVESLAAAGQLGYGTDPFGPTRQARGWPTVGTGAPRLDVVQFSFHHALLPLLPDSAVQKELALYREVYGPTWGQQVPASTGFFPSELAFSMRMIPLLQEAGIEWSFVSAEKLSRACPDFPVVLGSGGIQCDPPNRADQLNAPAGDFLRRTISRGCSPAEAYPFGFTPHRARYVDPTTGAASEIVVVPMAQALGWLDGYAPLSLSELDALQTKNDPQRPMLVVLGHDGDNAWAGGYDYYANAVPNFVGQAQGAGYHATVVNEYLADHPVPAGDYVHVEDGAWVNADGDFGAPQFLNWNWPPVNSSGQIDIENGWAEDIRNWAVLIAALNHVETAEQVWVDGGGQLDAADILRPSANSNAAERAWHYFLGGLNSGYMYYGTALDMEVKPTIAVNEALPHAEAVAGVGTDRTPPTVWIPQREVWNPGGANYGPQHGYQLVQDDGDFRIWTFAYDRAGVASVTLKLRADLDGQNPLSSDQNETYAGGTEVGAWTELPMTARAFPADNYFNDPGIDFFEMPAVIADLYHVEVAGVRDTLLDYYVEAVDTLGNVHRGPIQHVWVGDGSGAGGSDRVEVLPDPPQAGQRVEIRYDASLGPLGAASQIYLHAGVNDWAQVAPNDLAMSWDPSLQLFTAAGRVPRTASQLDFVFHDGVGNWDNNGGADWHVPVQGGGGGGQAWEMDGQLDAGAQLVAQNGGVRLWLGLQGDELYVATDPSPAGADRFLFVSRLPGALRAAPWAKAGQVADWDLYLANEGDNGFHAWFDGPAQGTAAARGQVLEGVVELNTAFGGIPPALSFAIGSYGTADGATLISTQQVPASLDGDGSIQAIEFLRRP